jgi:hypothetical protein
MTRILALLLALASLPARAGEVMRLTADLDGDRKPEQITLSTSGGNAEFKRFSLRVGSAVHEGGYFAGEGDLPQVSLLRVDRNKLARQLLISAVSAPAYCSYEVLSYAKGKLISLVKHGSKRCVAPHAGGDGRIEVLTWEGFWHRRDEFSSDASGTKMVLARRSLYPVEVSGVAARALALVPDRCREATIAPASQVLVKTYEPAKNRYLLMDYEGACGWIREVDLTESVRGLPGRVEINLP